MDFSCFNKFHFLKESAIKYNNPWIELVKNLCKKSICKDVSKLCKCKKTLKNGRLLNISAIYTAQYVGIQFERRSHQNKTLFGRKRVMGSGSRIAHYSRQFHCVQLGKNNHSICAAKGIDQVLFGHPPGRQTSSTEAQCKKPTGLSK